MLVPIVTVPSLPFVFLSKEVAGVLLVPGFGLNMPVLYIFGYLCLIPVLWHADLSVSLQQDGPVDYGKSGQHAKFSTWLACWGVVCW